MKTKINELHLVLESAMLRHSGFCICWQLTPQRDPPELSLLADFILYLYCIYVSSESNLIILILLPEIPENSQCVGYPWKALQALPEITTSGGSLEPEVDIAAGPFLQRLSRLNLVKRLPEIAQRLAPFEVLYPDSLAKKSVSVVIFVFSKLHLVRAHVFPKKRIKKVHREW